MAARTTGSSAVSRPDPGALNPRVRLALVVYAVVLLCLAAGFIFRQPWAIETWPFRYTGGMSYNFVASILAAAAASILYCGLSRDPRAMFGVGIDAAVINGPVAYLALSSGDASMRSFGVAAAATAAAGLGVCVWSRRYAWRDKQPTPVLVRVALAIFVVALWVVGSAMAAGSQKILPWEVSPEVARIYGWTFLGASTYLLYGAVVGVWSNAAGQLLGFLAYDLVLIPPFIDYFGHVAPDRLLNHVVYSTVVGVSAVLAVFYCFVLPRTRVFGRADRQ
jgi:hypothetical protein